MTLPSQYDPFSTEPKWQEHWASHDFYKAQPDPAKEAFCVVIPPPNITGNLHMGHALNLAIQDCLVRYWRMQGRDTLWLPGIDHASIATQTVVERELAKEALGITGDWGQLSEKQRKALTLEGSKQRKAIGRTAFLSRVWQWKAFSGGQIIHQIRRLGSSCDWSRERFTMDPALGRAVTTAFVRLHQEGLVYRGEYLVNWCPVSQSALSDLEVDAKIIQGSLWYLRYPVADQLERFVIVATTRPETMLGDTAVAVNPHDERYQDLIGKSLLLPIQNRLIPVIADDHVDPTFGTGCVKVTPAHDPNDFEMGKRHGLPFINLLNPDGTYNENAGVYQGLDRFEVRKQVVQWFSDHELLEKIEDYTHTVPHSERAGVPVEPYLTTQWYVRMTPLAERALGFLADQKPNFVPARWTKVYRDWLTGIHDWCISRQLWWGHQIPAWYIVGQETLDPIVAMGETEAYQIAQERFGPEVQLQRDEDVLDTWFSAGLWPFSTLGWPEATEDLARYFPTAVLVTGFDIIFFWVARMTMMSGYLTQQIPFQTVYINGLVRDEKGQKMSKSKGNGIDPLELMDHYGTDALRFTLLSAVAGAGQDIRIDYNRKKKESATVEAARNFANKLWNASRFVLLNLKTPPADRQAAFEDNKHDLELADRWILQRLQDTIAQVTELMHDYDFGNAVKRIYAFIWGDYCDWYIELAKPRFGTDTGPVAEHILVTVLSESLKLLHPWMPHITEEIYQAIYPMPDSSISVQPYPQVSKATPDHEVINRFEQIQNVIRTIRNLKAEAGIPPSLTVTVYLFAQKADKALLENNKANLEVFKSKIELYPPSEEWLQPIQQLNAKSFIGTVGTIEVRLPLTGLVDLDKLRVKLERDLAKKIKQSDGLRERLNGPNYREQAPAELVQVAEAELLELDQQIVLIKERLILL